MKVGIIGLGQSGKSSLFHTLTEQYPDPPSGKPHRRLGRALVPDEKVETIARLENSIKKTRVLVTRKVTPSNTINLHINLPSVTCTNPP